jgi:hypothetical protein
MPKIIVRIKKTGLDAGKTVLETQGFAGDTCMKNSGVQALKKVLGEVPGSEELTDEYYELQEMTETEEELL